MGLIICGKGFDAVLRLRIGYAYEHRRPPGTRNGLGFGWPQADGWEDIADFGLRGGPGRHPPGAWAHTQRSEDSALNLFQQDRGHQRGITARRKRAGWDQ